MTKKEYFEKLEITVDNIHEMAFAVACQGYKNFYAVGIECGIDDKLFVGTIDPIARTVKPHKVKIYDNGDEPYINIEGMKVYMGDFIRTDI